LILGRQASPESEIMALYEYGIYTIVEASKLAAASTAGRQKTFSEKKQWVTGRILLDRANKARELMPVVFADAADCSKLLYWGVLSRIQLGENGTKYAVKNLRKLEGRRRPQELFLRSTNKRIKPNYIRPYAIIKTPRFL
jgi:hypothetical protein